MQNWETILVGIVVVLVLLWLRPGIRAVLQQSREAQERDWMAVALPIAAVVAFVILLLALV